MQRTDHELVAEFCARTHGCAQPPSLRALAIAAGAAGGVSMPAAHHATGTGIAKNPQDGFPAPAGKKAAENFVPQSWGAGASDFGGAEKSVGSDGGRG